MKITDVVPQVGSVLPRPNLQASVRKGSGLWGFSSDRVYLERRATPWWLWWNILSLDAPTVAAAWAALFALASGTRLLPAEASALGLSVWIIYTCDRLLDGWSLRDRAALQERHLFSDRHRFILAVLVVAAAALVLWLMAGQSLATEARAGMKLGVIVVLYMVGIHARRSPIVRLLPKEIAVGFLFALGATLPLWSQSARILWQDLLSWSFFGLLCSLNCLSIECWENYRQRAGWRQAPHPFLGWAGPRINYFTAALAIVVLTTFLLLHPSAPASSTLLTTCAAALLLLLLNCFRTKLSSEALRVLADAALLAPALIALMLRG